MVVVQAAHDRPTTSAGARILARAAKSALRVRRRTREVGGKNSRVAYHEADDSTDRVAQQRASFQRRLPPLWRAMAAGHGRSRQRRQGGLRNAKGALDFQNNPSPGVKNFSLPFSCVDMEGFARGGREGEASVHGKSLQTLWICQCRPILAQWYQLHMSRDYHVIFICSQVLKKFCFSIIRGTSCLCRRW